MCHPLQWEKLSLAAHRMVYNSIIVFSEYDVRYKIMAYQGYRFASLRVCSYYAPIVDAV